MAEPTPWPKLLATALRLGLSPTQFWRLSLNEWRALVAPVGEALTRAAFDMLAQRFPDEQR
jgi:uncharacterized phage protein (TIGR02216 family)